MIRLGDYIKLIGGGTPSKAVEEYWGGEIPWISVKDLKADYLNRTVDSITQLGVNNSATNIIPANSLIVATRMAVGKAVITQMDAAINQDLKAIQITGPIDKKYLFYVFKNKKRHFENIATGATVKGIKIGAITDLKIPLPPLPQQKKIAAILDAADAYRQKTRALIGKYEELGQSLFLEMFGDPVRNEKGWEKKPMGEIMTIVRGGSPRPIKNFLGGRYPWIKIGDATKGDDIYLSDTKEKIIEAGLKKTRLLPKGSLIFANCGVSLGFARIIKIEGCIHDGWLAFSEFEENKINKIFLLKALNSITRYFRETAPDGTQPNLNTSIMKKFEIILPPIHLQNQFEESLELLIPQKVQAEASLAKAEDLFNSLLQKAFKGKLS
jgi:type I restriction enzyme S subunit